MGVSSERFMQADQRVALALSLGVHAVCIVVLILINTSIKPAPVHVPVITVHLVKPVGSDVAVKSLTPASSGPTNRLRTNKPQAIQKPSQLPQAIQKPSQLPLAVESTPIRLDDVQLQGGTGVVGDETAGGGGGEGGTSDATGSAGGGDGSSWDQGPSVASYVQPEYPLRLRGQGLEGDVVLAIVIDETGVPSIVTVVGPSSFEEFNIAAVRALEKTRFVPAMRGGNPIPTQIRFTVRFRLKD